MIRRSIPPTPYKSPIAIPSGETIKDILKSEEMSQKVFAMRMNRSEQEISYLINGKRSVTPSTAKQLELVLNIKASFWLNIEREYQDTVARIEEDKRLNMQVGVSRNYPYSEMVKFGLINATRKPIERVKNLLSYFQVADFKALENHVHAVVGANLLRRSDKFILSHYKLATWLRMGEVEAKELKLGKFNGSLLQKYLPEIRSFTLEHPKAFKPKLVKICSECGVAILFIREFRSFPVSGSARWVKKNPLVQVNLRNKTNDHFWFAVFHEIGHLLLHKKEKFLISIDKPDINNEIELEANQFARSTLISDEDYRVLISDKPYSKTKIVEFAEKIGIAPGIVVGRLQHDKKISWRWYNELKTPYFWKDSNTN